ncbi:MAG: hypothetical protein IJC82_01875, partial [Firmicutes bacterium]|nr:hypothetical protein [Bacillota bacterium]
MKRNKNHKQMFSVGDIFSAGIREKLIQTKLIWLWIAFFFATVVILLFSAVGNHRSLQVGDIAPDTLIYEGSSFSYTSDVAYDKAVAEIESGVNDVYTLDNTKIDNLNHQIDDFLDKMASIKKESDPTSETVVSIYKGLFGDGDSAAVYAAALNDLSLQEITDVAMALRSYFVSSYAVGIKESDMEAYMDDLYNWIHEGFSEEKSTAAQALVSTLAL